MTWRVAVAVVVGTFVLGVASAAVAGFAGSTVPQSTSMATLAVASVTGLSATTACGTVGSLSATVSLTWTGTTTARATSYVVRRTTTGVYADVATVATGATSWTNTGLVPGTSYSFLVRTFVGPWYADPTPVTITTAAPCL